MFRPPGVQAGDGFLATLVGRDHLCDEHPNGDHGIVNSVAEFESNLVADLEDFGAW